MKPKHSNGNTCPSCDEKLTGAHPTLKAWWNRIKKQFPDAHLSWVWRDKAMQELFFSMGKSHAQWPTSKHNYMKNGSPYAEAMDLFKLRDDNVSVFPMIWYQSIWDYLVGAQAPMRWGQLFKHPDGDHFELTRSDV